jgi:hypothetical protein
LAATLPKTINNSFTQSIIHVAVELEHLAWGTIPLALALATSISMPSGVPMPFHQPPHYAKTINNSCTQSTIHLTVELEHLAWGTIPLALALATSLDMPRGVLMPFHWPPHYTK